MGKANRVSSMASMEIMPHKVDFSKRFYVYIYNLYKYILLYRIFYIYINV